MKSKTLKESILVVMFIIGIILSASIVLSMAAVISDTEGTILIRDDFGSETGTSTTTTTGGGGYALCNDYPGLDCQGMEEFYPPFKLQTFCGIYSSACEWDSLDGICANIDGASCSSITDSLDCDESIGCYWGTLPGTDTSSCGSGLTDCSDVGLGCVNLYSDESNCGECGKECSIGQTCNSGSCLFTTGLSECDPASSTPKPCTISQFHTGVQRCVAGKWQDCESDTGECGDKDTNGTETCDANGPATSCDANGKPGTHLCKEDCSGYKECVPTMRCFPDCSAEGRWLTYNEGFSVNSNEELTFTGTGTATIMGDGLDLFAGKTYSFNANIEGNVTVYLNGTCVSNTTFTQIDCGLEKTLYNGTTLIWSFTMPAATGGHAINGLYYRNVSIYLVFAGPGKLANITLRESPGAHYDDYPEATSNTGCCPSDYCWDGKMCVDSSTWMTNPSAEPVWNNIFDVEVNNWTNGHVNTSAVYAASGFRCVKYNSTTPAQWTLSKIKYDWNFVKSGYCGRETDCFVTNNSDYPLWEDTSKGCAPNGSMVSSDAAGESTGGNHYCHMGNWTTKSYIVATLLQNLAGDYPYTLHCYDDPAMLYNLELTSDVKVDSACVLTMHGDSQIITGIVLETDNSALVNTYIDNLAYDYRASVGVDTDVDASCTTPDAELLDDTTFSKCVTGSGDVELHVYYDTQYKFLILSNREIVGIEDFNIFEEVWMAIKNFFGGIFSKSVILEDSEPYTSINYTTSYDRIFVIRDEGLNVTAIEEYKFDENLGKPVTLFYISHEGSSNDTNPINALQLFKSINRTVSDADLTLAKVEYIYTPNTQELIVKTDETTGIWSYFTAVLRTRPPGGGGTSMAGFNEGAHSTGTQAYSDDSSADVSVVESSVVDGTTVETPVDNTASVTDTPRLPAVTGGIIIDHTSTDLSKIPDCWIEEAKNLTVHYAHTSHGGQIIQGAETLEDADSTYNINVRNEPSEGLPAEGTSSAIRIYDGNNILNTAIADGPMYITPERYWDGAVGIGYTESVVSTGDYDISMWAWCGQQSTNTEAQVEEYLSVLSAFQEDYPNMRFVLMTGHTDGSDLNDETAALTRNNQMLRDYAEENDMILFDFADIESYDPAGNFYPTTTDACPWCTSWCSSHPSDCQTLPAECAHSHGFNCVQKAKAFWWMMARVAGWDGTDTDCDANN